MLTPENMSQPGYVGTSEYYELRDALRKLRALEACGVDNWEGYDEAMELYRESVDG